MRACACACACACAFQLWFEREEHVVLEDGEESIVQIPPGGWVALSTHDSETSETSHERVGSVPEETIHSKLQTVEPVRVARKGLFVSNQFWEVSFDDDGCISSLVGVFILIRVSFECSLLGN